MYNIEFDLKIITTNITNSQELSAAQELSLTLKLELFLASVPGELTSLDWTAAILVFTIQFYSTTVLLWKQLVSTLNRELQLWKD